MIVLVGVGNIGLELLKTLPKDVQVVAIEKDPEKEPLFKELRPQGRFILGDATSRLVLKEAPINEAECVIITTTREEVTLEVASILHEHFQPRRVISVGITYEGIKKLEEMAIEVEPIFSATALGIRNRLQPKTKAAHGIGLGKGEVLEVEVHPHSRLANRAIGSLAPLRWRIGLIYRGENIILPRRDVMLKPGDRVLIVGEPSVLKTVSELFTFSFQRFPLEYGTTAVVYLSGREEEAFIEEVKYVLGGFPFQKAFIVFPSEIDRERYLAGWEELKEFSIVLRESPLEPLLAMEELFYEIHADQGLVIVSDKLLRHYSGFLGLMADYRAKTFLQKLIDNARCPVLVSKGTFPYKKTLVPALVGTNFSISLEKAVEISHLLQCEINVLVVEPSRYTVTDEELGFLQDVKKEINELGLLHKKSINVLNAKGNPVRHTISIAKDFQLLIIGSSGWEQRAWVPSFVRADLLWLCLKRSPISTLLIPSVEEAL